MQQPDILRLSLDLLEQTHLATSIPDEEDARSAFERCEEQLRDITTDEQNTSTLWKKYCVLGMTVFSCSALNDMVKIVWRMVKDIGGSPEKMLCLFMLGIAAILETQRARQGEDTVRAWEKRCISWLGRQITIGGKGVTGDGDGSTVDRIQSFFNTPYLHDFD